MRSKLLRARVFLASLPLIVAAAAASAQTGPTPPDYSAAATAAVNGLIPIVTVVLPISVGLLVIVKGPKLAKRIISGIGGV